MPTQENSATLNKRKIHNKLYTLTARKIERGAETLSRTRNGHYKCIHMCVCGKYIHMYECIAWIRYRYGQGACATKRVNSQRIICKSLPLITATGVQHNLPPLITKHTQLHVHSHMHTYICACL